MSYTKAHSLWESVGNTPLLKIASLSKLTGCEIFAKAEFLNPGGSIKDRAAKGIIASAEKEGKLKKGFTIVEGTAGNTGIGLALLGRERGYRVVVTMPNNQALEKYQLLEALGAEIIAVPPCPFANEKHFYHQARIYAETHAETFWANQFENTANADFHYQSTGPEIWEQCEGKVDVLVLAVGSGGTIAGTSRFLKEKNPNIKVMVSDPYGSGLYEYVKNGELKTEGGSITEGIGIMRLTENFKRAQVDDAMRVADQSMIEMLYHLAQQDALFVGTSGALNARAAFEIGCQNSGTKMRIVTFLCDSGSRYQSKIMNPDWLREKNLEIRPLTL